MTELQTQKNILDLNYQKHLQIATASVIIFFTIVIGIVIAFITSQLNLSNIAHLLSVAIVLFVFGSISLSLVVRSSIHMKRIIKAIERLK